MSAPLYTTRPSAPPGSKATTPLPPHTHSAATWVGLNIGKERHHCVTIDDNGERRRGKPSTDPHNLFIKTAACTDCSFDRVNIPAVTQTSCALLPIFTPTCRFTLAFDFLDLAAAFLAC